MGRFGPRVTFVLLGLLLARVLLPSSLLPWLSAAVVAGTLALGALAVAWSLRRANGSGLWGDPGVWVLVAALAVLLFTLATHRFRLTSDGIDHYVYLRSVFEDGDLDLANDYALVSPRGEAALAETPLGRTGNVHPIGPALLWSPFYAAADLLAAALGRRTDGLDELHTNAVAVASVGYGWLGLLLLYRAASATARRVPALLATLGIAFGSFLYWYLAYAPTMAHAQAFAVAALFVWLWRRPAPAGWRRAACLGACCGLLALVRWPDGLIALLCLADWLPRLRERLALRSVLAEVAAFAVAAVVVFSPQMIVWKLLYGSLLTVPQGTGFLAGSPAWSGVLFSPRHGLFAWSPILYLGALGLIPWLRSEPRRALAAVAFFLALARLNAGVADWWGGAAFGGRRFDATLPLFGIATALAIEAGLRFARRRPESVAVAFVALAVGWNLLLADRYRSGAWDYAGPVSFEEMGHAVVSGIDRRTGSPFGLPGALFARGRDGTPLTAYESLFMDRPHARWSIRMGLDDRIFLEDGWSAPQRIDDVPCRFVTGSAGVVLPIHQATRYRLGARLAAPDRPLRVRVVVNQRSVAVWDVAQAWADWEVDLAEEWLRPGRNQIRLRLLEPGDARLAVAGLWAAVAAADDAPAASAPPAAPAVSGHDGGRER